MKKKWIHITVHWFHEKKMEKKFETSWQQDDIHTYQFHCRNHNSHTYGHWIQEKNDASYTNTVGQKIIKVHTKKTCQIKWLNFTDGFGHFQYY